MNHWMRAPAARMVAVLFGLSLVLTACDAQHVLQMLDGTASQDTVESKAPAAGDAASDHDAPNPSGSSDEDVADAAAADEDAETAGKTERREFQCRRGGVQRAATAASDDREGSGGADDRADSDGEDDGAAPAPAAVTGGGDDAEANAAPAPTKPKVPDGSERAADQAGASSAPAEGGDAASTRLSAIEQGIFELLNRTRGQAGLKPLTLLADISRGAREWSCDMAGSGNFRHADLRSAGVYGENIAWGQRSAAEVHQGWMDSPGHNRNRMNTRWSEYGVGVCDSDGGRLYFTERFR